MTPISIILSVILILGFLLIFLTTYKRKNMFKWSILGVICLLCVYGLLTGNVNDFLKGFVDGLFGV